MQDENQLLKQAQKNSKKVLELARADWPSWYLSDTKIEFEVLRRLGKRANDAILQVLLEKLTRGISPHEVRATSELCQILGEINSITEKPQGVKKTSWLSKILAHFSFKNISNANKNTQDANLFKITVKDFLGILGWSGVLVIDQRKMVLREIINGWKTTNNQGYESLCIAAITALGKIGGTDCIDFLHRIRLQPEFSSAYVKNAILESLSFLGHPIDDAKSMLTKAELFYNQRLLDDALNVCERLKTYLNELTAEDKGWYWGLHARIVRAKHGNLDPKIREYCLRSLHESLENVGAWEMLGYSKVQLTSESFQKAVEDTPGIEDLKKELGVGTFKGLLRECDNVGVRITSYEQALGLMMRTPPEPKLVYIFHSIDKIQKAFFDLPFISLANDTEKMISTEIIGYGFYEVDENLYHAVLIGKGLTYKLWEEAKRTFNTHGGKLFGETEPTNDLPNITEHEEVDNSNDVIFVREYDETSDRGGTKNLVKYTIYRAGNKASAVSWLSKNPVTENFHYVIIETPEGNFGRDIQGIYQE